MQDGVANPVLQKNVISEVRIPAVFFRHNPSPFMPEDFV
ncbi:Uncharacterized protein dnm_086290 [Desulfonema magnum]|uniref:Uncharacterized protein n=1 Tax=Desulfonema magnum TaxID=45655 RepID=A0A975GSZ2_9BACT|nr:Uncharacterized protein dnm_086290 [Desulfonema magnum]